MENFSKFFVEENLPNSHETSASGAQPHYYCPLPLPHSSMTLLHSSSPSIVEQENIDTEFEATIQDEEPAPLDHEYHEEGEDAGRDGQDLSTSSEADVSLVMQQHQQVL